MTTERMTIHKALSELKILDSRIKKEMTKATFCGTKKNVDKVINGVPVDSFEESVKSEYTKINDMIKRREAIKRAVSNSNAITKVNIGDKEYSVAEAIEMNRCGIELYDTLLKRLEDQYEENVNYALESNGDLQERTDQYIGILYGTKDAKPSSEAAKAAEEYRKNYETKLVDPIDIQGKIAMLRDYIDKFKSDVDSALSVSNAITEIEITY